jgi:hypothetical protein
MCRSPLFDHLLFNPTEALRHALTATSPTPNAFFVHELALMDDLVRTILERIERGRVVTVRLSIGRDAAVDRNALEQSFEVCAQGTPIEGAELRVEMTEGMRMSVRDVEVIDDVQDMRV